MNRTKTVLIGASSAIAAGAIIAGGVDLATAATGSDPAAPTSGCMGPGGPAGHDHTTVTGSERTKVVQAVKAEHPDVTVTTVVQDEDGSYDVMGTQGGQPVRLEVSKDLATVELETGRPGMGPGMGGVMGGHHGWGDDDNGDDDASESGAAPTTTT